MPQGLQAVVTETIWPTENVYFLALNGKHLPTFGLKALRSHTVLYLRAERQTPGVVQASSLSTF